MDKNKIFKQIYHKHLKFLRNLDFSKNKRLIICFAGVPGSGKTRIAKVLEKSIREQESILMI